MWAAGSLVSVNQFGGCWGDENRRHTMEGHQLNVLRSMCSCPVQFADDGRLEDDWVPGEETRAPEEIEKANRCGTSGGPRKGWGHSRWPAYSAPARPPGWLADRLSRLPAPPRLSRSLCLPCTESTSPRPCLPACACGDAGRRPTTARWCWR